MVQTAPPDTGHTVLHSASSLLDIGLNLAHDSFDRDRDDVMARALRAGVTRMLVTGSSIASTHAAVALVDAHPEHLRCTAGVHPHHAVELNEGAAAELASLVRRPQVLAVGECGLDYYRDLAPRPAQRSAFERQLGFAIDSGKPVFLHARDAHEDFIAIVRAHRAQLAGGVAHCFTGTLEQALACLELDLHLGITGWICDERRGDHLKEVVRHIPADRLLLETDAPYLLPRDLVPRPKDRRNEPAYLPHVLHTIAAAREQDPDTLAAITTANALKLFRWPGDFA
jgi:TatD DNase family protein